MDVQKEREAFEKQGNIRIFVKQCLFDEQLNEYSSKSLHDYTLGFINGAWWAWQAKAQAVPEGFVLVSAEQMSQWGHMANCAQEYGCPECYEARGYAHSLACEINAYFNVSEAQEPAND